MSRDKSRLRRRTQKGTEIIEFGLVAAFLVPAFVGAMLIGLNLILGIGASQAVRSIASMYMHGGDFSSAAYQQIAKRIAGGLDLEMPDLGTTNAASNLGSTGRGVIWVTKLMYVGSVTDPQCVAAGGATRCVNHDSFVFLQRVVFGNSSLASTHPSLFGSPAGAVISDRGVVSNPVTDANARVSGTSGASPQGALMTRWQTTANGQRPLVDGQVMYVAEGFFSTTAISIGRFRTQGVYARYFF